VTTTTGQLASGGATSVYVAQGSTTSDSILQFSATASGSVSPSATLLAPTSLQVFAVAVDSSGQIYVAGQLSQTGPFEILVYPAGSAGSATPTRTITQTFFGAPSAMIVSSSGLLYVTGYSSAIAVYSSTASGSAAPMALIQGSATQLGVEYDIAVDPSGNIYVTNDTAAGTISVFAAGANGNVAPIRTITPASSSTFAGIAFDSSGNLYAVENQTPASGAFPSVASIVEFAPGATGAATPTKTITASALTDCGGLTRDSVGNLYLVDATFSGVSPNVSIVTSVLGFGPNASGAVTPGINLTSSAWTLGGGEIAVK
jgi:hypothetical protein